MNHAGVADPPRQRPASFSASSMGRGLWRRLWSSPSATPWQGLADQFRSYARAILVVRIFYASGIYLIYQETPEWRGALQASSMAAPWTLDWVPQGSVPQVVPWILGGYLTSAIAVAALPQLRALRALYFLMLLQAVSLLNSFGSIRHTHHAWLWVAAVLVFLPDRRWAGRTTTEQRHYFLTTVWLAQVAVAAFYSLTGFWKVVGIGEALLTGKPSMLGFGGFVRTIERQQASLDEPAILSDFLIDHPHLTWAMYLGTIYIELVAVLVAFRPRLHRAWGLLLIGFHLATELAMRISFLPSVVVLAVLFVGSPLTPNGTRVKDAILDLPGVYMVRRRFGRPAEGRVA